LRRRAHMNLWLEATPDILARLPSRRDQLRVGFALEGGRVVPAAARKLRAKRLDVLVAQRLNGKGSPFGRRRVQAWLLARRRRVGSHPGAGQTVRRLGRVSKAEVARALLDKVEELWYGQRRPHEADHVAKT